MHAVNRKPRAAVRRGTREYRQQRDEKLDNRNIKSAQRASPDVIFGISRIHFVGFNRIRRSSGNEPWPVDEKKMKLRAFNKVPREYNYNPPR